MSKKTNAQLALEYEDVLELLTMQDANDIEDEDVKMVVRAVLPLISFLERKLGETVGAVPLEGSDEDLQMNCEGTFVLGLGN